MLRSLVNNRLSGKPTIDFIENFRPVVTSISDSINSKDIVRIKFLFRDLDYEINDLFRSKIYRFLVAPDKHKLKAYKFCSDLIEGIEEKGFFKLPSGAIVRK